MDKYPSANKNSHRYYTELTKNEGQIYIYIYIYIYIPQTYKVYDIILWYILTFKPAVLQVVSTVLVFRCPSILRNVLEKFVRKYIFSEIGEIYNCHESQTVFFLHNEFHVSGSVLKWKYWSWMPLLTAKSLIDVSVQWIRSIWSLHFLCHSYEEFFSICIPKEKVRQWSGRPGFSPRSSHTKDSKNGTWCLLA